MADLKSNCDKLNNNEFNMRMLELGKELLHDIVKANYEAYIVGGTVRDIAMGHDDIHDVDIATNMPIEIIKNTYKTVEYGGGEKHGTIIVVYKGYSFELTQFRCDGFYTDGRRPDDVTFVEDFKTDCSRRDFTINAMGMNTFGSIVDFFNGMSDIQLGIIKTVGNAHDRFNEDALRMIRACRFAGRFNFKIEDDTIEAIKSNKHLISNVSKERILDEIKKASSYGGIAFAKFITYMYTTGLLDLIICIKLSSKNFKEIISALEYNDSKDFNTNLVILLFECDESVKDDLKLSNENLEVIKFVNDNYSSYSLLNQMSRIKAYEICSHKHFKVLRACYIAFEKHCELQDTMVSYVLEYKDAYDQQSIISDEMLKTVKPSKAFGFMKREMLESHLHEFEMTKKLKSEDKIRIWVDEWLQEDKIFG
jgi:tRNA nucleotidyltransferase (CCA-adding enzyme)